MVLSLLVVYKNLIRKNLKYGPLHIENTQQKLTINTIIII